MIAPAAKPAAGPTQRLPFQRRYCTCSIVPTSALLSASDCESGAAVAEQSGIAAATSAAARVLLGNVIFHLPREVDVSRPRTVDRNVDRKFAAGAFPFPCFALRETRLAPTSACACFVDNRSRH